MAIFNVIFPIFAIALGGYLVAYKGILSSQDIKGLSRFVFMVAFPVLLFNSFSRMDLPEHINWKFLFSYYMVALTVFALGMLIYKLKFFASEKDKVIFGLGSSYSNLVLVGLPILSSAIGEQIILPLFMIVSLQSAVFFTLSSILIEQGDDDGDTSRLQIFGQAVRRMARNPIILSLFLGLVFNLTKIPIPGMVADTFDLFTRAALPCALFMLGATLSEHKIAGHGLAAVTLVGLKMVLQPLLVWVLAFPVFNVDPLFGSVAVLAAGMPIGVNTFLFAESYQADTQTISAAILLSSIFAIVSQSVLLSIFI